MTNSQSGHERAHAADGIADVAARGQDHAHDPERGGDEPGARDHRPEDRPGGRRARQVARPVRRVEEVGQRPGGDDPGPDEDRGDRRARRQRLLRPGAPVDAADRVGEDDGEGDDEQHGEDRWTQIIVACPSTAIPADRKNTTTSAMTLPASPALSQPSTGRSAATAKTPKTVLIASKATEVTQASAPLAAVAAQAERRAGEGHRRQPGADAARSRPSRCRGTGRCRAARR